MIKLFSLKSFVALLSKLNKNNENLAQCFASLKTLANCRVTYIDNLVFTNSLRKCPHALLDLAVKKPVSASAQPWDAHYTHHLQFSKLFFVISLLIYAKAFLLAHPYTNKRVVLIVKNPCQLSDRDFGLEA